MGSARPTMLATVIVLALVATGCGSDRNDDSEATGDDGAPALSAAQFDELDRIYRAGLPLDDAPGPAALRAATFDVARACERADTSDRLVAVVVESCRDAAAAAAGLYDADCSTPGECARLARGGARLFATVATALEKAEPVVAAEVGDADCRAVLVPPDGAAAFERGATVFRETADALLADDAAALDTLAGEFQRMLADLESITPSGKAELAAFREACGP